MSPRLARIATDRLRAAARLCVVAFTLVAGAASAATTLTATPTSVVPTATVTAEWSGIASPTTTDWLALYSTAGGGYLSWRYTTGTASGSVPFTIPGWVSPGTYELRLLWNNGNTVLATSNSFTVSAVTISGTVTASGAPLAGVTFAVSSGGICPPSNTSGQYTCTVPSGWSGSVTPSSGSYVFTPASRNYSNVTANQTGQNYTTTATITLNATPANVAPGGTVTAAWSGIPSPSGTDWIGLFRPGESTILTWRYTTGAASGNVPFTIPAGQASGTYELRLFANNGYTLLATSNNFTINVSISGTVTLGGSPVAGVAFTASNGGTCTASNASGQYSCSVPPGWSGTVTPTPGAYVFTPASRSYSNVTVHQTGQNYTATVAYQVSGTVTLSGSPLAGVAFAATNGAGPCTSSNASGQYSCTVATGWSGTVTPTLAPHTFTPASRNYTNVTAHQTAQDYASVTFQVSGTVMAGGSPLAGVAFAVTNGGNCTNSNASGQYSCTVLHSWSGDVTPILAGYLFTPGWRTYNIVTADQTAQDYTAAPAVQVSGTVTLNSSPLANVAFAATNGGSCFSSNASGQYSCTVPQGWSGSVTPWLTGYSFTPVSRNFTNVTGALTGQDFTATEGGAAAGIYYVHADHLNSPRLITNQAGQAVWRWDQSDPFGGNVANDNPSGLGTFTYNLRFPGQYFDKETGLFYNWFRYLDSNTGRYVQTDPVGIRAGLNTYGYVLQHPLGMTDPTGLITFPEAYSRYCSGKGAPLTISYGEVGVTGITATSFSSVAGVHKMPCVFADIPISDSKPYTTSGPIFAVLGDVTLKLDGLLRTSCDCSWDFTGVLTVADDLFNFNPSTHRSLGAEIATTLLRWGGKACGAKPFTIRVSGGQAIKETGKVNGTPTCCGAGTP